MDPLIRQADEVTGDDGHDMVVAVMTGEGRLAGLVIAAQVMRGLDHVALGEAVVSAYRQARRFTGTADEEGVVATVDADGTLLDLRISALSKRRHDEVTLADAVIAADDAAGPL